MFIVNAWRALASTRTTAAIAIAMALMAFVAVLVPQGDTALALARYENSEAIQAFHTWGLTTVLESAWLKVLLVLLAGNLVALAAASMRPQATASKTVELPDRAAEDTKMVAAKPEAAVEALRETFRSIFGAPPAAERVEGARVVMAFNAGKQAKLAPLWAHLGLILLVVGAVWATQPPPGGKLMVRALLKVQDSRTGAIGHFDMVQDDPRQFFQWRAQYVIRSYSASRAGLGPAIRLERAFPDQQRRDDFWVYRDAPEEFDQKHRQGMVSISAKKLGIVPVPGSGLTSSGAAVLLLFGLGFLVYGAAAGTQAQGRLWIDVDGRDVRLAGAPQKAGDPLFTQAFRRWDLVARTALTE